jgi:hypothetical protein
VAKKKKEQEQSWEELRHEVVVTLQGVKEKKGYKYAD